MGAWTHRVSRHKHDTPKTQATSIGEVLSGDRWRCECGDEFEVLSAITVYDQRDGDYYSINWTLYNSAAKVLNSSRAGISGIEGSVQA